MSLQNKANRIQDIILKQEIRSIREKQMKDQIEQRRLENKIKKE